jgi:hypothetical protein
MKFIILTLVIFCTQNTFAQLPYTDFVQADTAIQWAAEYDQILNITPKITRFGIRNLMHAKLMRGECIDNYTTNSEGAVKGSFCLKDTGFTKGYINGDLNPYYFKVKYDEMEGKAFAWSEMPGFYALNLKRNNFHIYKVKQIITYKNAALSVQNILVSPIFLKKMNEPDMSNFFSWHALYATSFNNKNAKLSKIEKQKCVDLGNLEEKYDLNYALFDTNTKAKIFTKFNPILSKHIFEDIVAKKITAVDLFDNLIPANKIDEVNNPQIEVNEFDSAGNVTGILKLRNEVNLDSIYNFTINQHFYYDSTNNILHSEINFINVNKRFISPQGLDYGIGFHFRIYFVKPSQYKKRPQKRYLNFRES